MLRVHFMQRWFGLSDPAMEEALHDVPPCREFSGLERVRSILCEIDEADQGNDRNAFRQRP
jgi:IS5 family transposase